MKGVSSDLLFVLLFALIFLGQYVVQRFRARKQRQDAGETGLPEPVEPAPALQWQWELPAVSTGAASSVTPEVMAPERRPGRRDALAARTGRRFSREVLFSSRRKLQDAIVIASILGPCRAQEPHDIRQ